MLTLQPQYITDSQGNKISVVLSLEEFRKVIGELVELEDVRPCQTAGWFMMKPNKVSKNLSMPAKLSGKSKELIYKMRTV